jgi:hypothetical protein
LKNLIYFKGAGLEMALPFYCPTFDTCYVSKILTVGSEPVISF